MTVKDFIKSNPAINITGLAKLMWPKNDDAGAYLTRKLSDKGDRPFTKNDAEKAIKALKELSVVIDNLTID